MPTGVTEQVKAEIENIVKIRGVELVEFKIFFSGGKQIVRCLVDYPGGGINIDECSCINRDIFSFLERERFFGDDFAVEVNSPGIDRPLKTKHDFARRKGKITMLWLSEPVDGQNYYEGILSDINDCGIVLTVRDKIREISFDKIKFGKEKIG